MSSQRLSFPSSAWSFAALVVLLAAPAAWADLFGGDIPLLGTLVTQGSQQLSNAAQLIRTASEQLTAAKRLPVGVEHLVSKHLKGEWSQVSEIGYMGVFFVKQRQDLLRHVLRLFLRCP